MFSVTEKVPALVVEQTTRYAFTENARGRGTKYIPEGKITRSSYFFIQCILTDAQLCGDARSSAGKIVIRHSRAAQEA